MLRKKNVANCIRTVFDCNKMIFDNHISLAHTSWANNVFILGHYNATEALSCIYTSTKVRLGIMRNTLVIVETKFNVYATSEGRKIFL